MKTLSPSLPPRDLFLRLIEWRPRNQIAVRIEAIPDVELWARAMPSADFMRAPDAQARCALALCDRDGNRLLSHEDIGLLSPAEWARVERAVMAELDVICPTYGRVSATEWEAAIERGAKECPAQYGQIYQSFDLVLGGKKPVFRRRPDRYFGRPMCELLDGHLMVFSAIQSLINKQFI